MAGSAVTHLDDQRHLEHQAAYYHLWAALLGARQPVTAEASYWSAAYSVLLGCSEVQGSHQAGPAQD